MSAASYTSSSPPPGQAESSTPATTQRHKDFGALESPSDFGSPDFSTPKPQRNVDLSTANYASPYEKLRREVQGAKNIEEDTPLSTLPSTPRAQTYGDEIADSSPFAPPSTARNTKTPAQDVLLHRVLDKNYRIQATPHAQPQLPKPTTNTRHAKTPTTIRNGYTTALDFDSSPMEEAPQLHIDDFRSPTKERRVPGVSVLTPAKPSARKTGKMPEATQVMQTTSWDSDSDEDGFPEGMSPPKTMQFHIPQSKLLKTPAQEASKRIVEDLLATAGPDTTEEFDGDDSPSVVKRGGLLEEDTF
jgi:DASH complex subunit ASK1